MKFGKELQRLVEDTMPKWKDRFLSYKILKQQVKRIRRSPREKMLFARLLAREIIKFNAFFTDKEEDFVIRLQDLKEKAIKRKNMLKVRRDLVRLHGEMVLLKNYSSLNCTGLLKLLKKHDKLNNSNSTEALLRLPFIQNVLRQPFFRTELLTEMIQDCEQALLEGLSDNQDGELEEAEEEEGSNDLHQNSITVGYSDEDVKRNTLAALQTIQHLRRGSSTYGPSSLRYHDLFEADNSSTTTF